MSYASRPQQRLDRVIGHLALALILAAPAAALAKDSQQDLTELGFEELLNIQITSVSKRPQRMVDTAAAVFVLTAEDIRRSGHTSIPELLRMVPGVNVGKATASGWQVGIRGDQDKFSRTLLPLLDGRSLYTPAFSGTYWDAQEVPLHDIERIEVIRGPGASVWGSNAVQGVINIIRKPVDDESGAQASILAGNEERLLATVSNTFGLGEDTRLRLSGRYLNRDSGPARTEHFERPDDYSMGTLHFRLDSALSERDDVTLQGDWHGGMRGGGFRVDQDRTGNNFMQIATHYAVRGGNAMFKWHHAISERASTDFQLYWDETLRKLPIGEELRGSGDVELRTRWRLGERHDLSFGGGARHQRDRWSQASNLMVTPRRNQEAIYNAFVQDEFAIVPQRLSLTLGSKFEWNTYTGWETQPTARFLYHLTEHQQIWGSVARAVRTPARSDREIRATIATVAGIEYGFQGTDEFDSEFVTEFDLGWRAQPTSTLQIDLAAFTRETENFKIYVGLPGAVLVEGVPVPATNVNTGECRALGTELSVRWQPQPSWRLLFNWTHENISGSLPLNAQGGELSAPHHQLDVISSWTLPHGIELDLAFYYNGRMRTIGGTEIKGYRRHDARIAWLPRPDLELALVGQNLLDREHHEARDLFEIGLLSGFGDPSVARSVYVELRKRY